MENVLLVIVKYIGPTDHRGARVSLHAPHTLERVVIPFDYELNGITEMATAYLKTKGIKPFAQCETANEYALMIRAKDGRFPSIR